MQGFIPGGTASKQKAQDILPGGPVFKKPPPNARDVGSIPGRGTKIPHAMGQLSLHTATKTRPSQK